MQAQLSNAEWMQPSYPSAGPSAGPAPGVTATSSPGQRDERVPKVARAVDYTGKKDTTSEYVPRAVMDKRVKHLEEEKQRLLDKARRQSNNASGRGGGGGRHYQDNYDRDRDRDRDRGGNRRH